MNTVECKDFLHDHCSAKMILLLIFVISTVLLGCPVSTLGQQQDPLCPKHEWIPDCVPCIRDCDDIGNVMCDSTFHCIPNDDCHCLPGYARIFKKHFCIPESHCEHPFHEIFEPPAPVDEGDPIHRIAHHDLKRKNSEGREALVKKIFAPYMLHG